MAKARDAGPVAVFDLGDDLSARLPVPESERARDDARAELVLNADGKLPEDGLVVGERDVALGVDRLVAWASAAHVPLLSANLSPSVGALDGGPSPFVGHVEVQAGALLICAVAVQGAGDYGPGLVRSDPAAAASAELAKLEGRPCDVRLLLAHMDRFELDRVLPNAKGFDAVAIGHQGSQQAPQNSGEIPVFYDGERGRAVGRILFASALAPGVLAGADQRSPFLDQSEGERLAADQKRLRAQLDDLKARRKAAKGAAVASADRAVESLERRLDELAAQGKKAEHLRDPRVFHFDWVNLGTDVADEPVLKTEVDQFVETHPEPVLARPMAVITTPDGGVRTAATTAMDGGGGHLVPAPSRGVSSP